MIEALIISVCAVGSPDACNKAAESYYRQEHLDVIVDRLKKENKNLDKVLSFTAAAAVVIKDHKAIVNLYVHNGYNLSYDQETDKQMFILKKEL